jgi:uncharacterized protein
MMETHPTAIGTAKPEHLRRLAEIVQADPDPMLLLGRLRDLDLPEWRLVSGALYGTVWNALTGRPRRHGIKDYDIAYFDGGDLSWEAEDAVIRRVDAATAELGLAVETRNQARVHLWFERRFGIAVPPLRSTDESLTRYASIVHAVGVRLRADGALDIVAPFGLNDLFIMRIRPNRVLDNGPSHAEKAARAKTMWPEVSIEA